MLDKTTRMNYLLDFYQALLTPKQRNYMEMYYLEDYSLGEISEEANVSRQAVYDNIKRTETMLESYEKKLHLYDKFEKRMKLIQKIEEQISDSENQQFTTYINQLKELD
ncbi:putative DNA-binding protein [Paucisalibacillus sp. EB02]|uniref:putative DNA-binding protein n=1 Tax=Paucisalibacillus sp. EB02 TaxID=1347087 RepID=UPI0004B17067|nr:putative DNA-binding protein [Paucisalibacillus sp. EB02]